LRNKKIYGLIGKDIDYSFSRKYFLEKFKNEKFNHYNYLNFDLKRIELIEEILTNNKLNGLNVTIPYKEKIIPFLDELSPVAKEIGSVNTICFVGSKKIGYNTDIYGFDKTLSALNIDEIDYALVLGTGGASKAISYFLSKRKIKFNHVSRTLKKDYLKYDELDHSIFNQKLLIVNTTPLGTFPNTNEFPDIPYNNLNNNHILYDLVYNPKETTFMKKGIERGSRVINGLKMLEYQAEKSWELWSKFN